LRCNGYVFATGNTGKTAVALLAFAERRRKGGGRALIIAPKTLLEAAWTEEIDKYFPHLRYSVAYASNREKAFSVKADVYITNTDAVKWLKTQPKRFFSTFDTLIIDESSAFKHHASQRSKAIKKLAPLFKYRSLLTATPFSKSVTEMWHQILLLDDGAHFGRSYTKFRDAVCEPYYEEGQNTHPKWRDRPGAYATIVQMISDICIRHEFHDVMKNVPHGTEHKVFFKLPPKLRSAYEELKESLILKLESGEVTALNAAILRGKLLQVASGSVYGSSGAATIDDGRTELVCDLVEQRKHSVVFYNWDHQREALVNAFTKRGIVFAEISSKHKGSVRNETVQKYQAGEFQTLLMHPQTGAHGLTLTRGTATLWCSPTDRPDLLIQGKHRVLRGGQTEVTENVMVCARGTIEEGVYQKTDRERDAIAELLSLIKESR